VSRAATALAILLLLAGPDALEAQAPATPAAEEPGAIGPTPPRLSFVDGQVSFWRPGAEEWMAARPNTPLAAGDEIYTGSPGVLEIQIGGRAYVRAWARTQLGLAGLEPDFVQVKVTTGHVSLDLRRLDAGHTVEVDTPNAAFTIERPGYYRVTVTDSRTSFITRRGGRATVTPADGAAAAVASSEEVIVEGRDSPQVSTYVAPELDAWDRWNYARTDALIDALSSRYVPPDVYGVDDLDQHGSWRLVETYGPVWVPTGVPAGWVPYSTGTWMWDPFYGWTWVDAAPWGWAPYHHGRWVFVNGFWAWAPGPVVARAIYAPALVGFFGPRVGVTIGVRGPAVGWVALGWGEPIIPWWGPVGFIGVPRWIGWGGPRFVNNVVISRTTVVHVHEIHVYRNAGVRHAVTVVPRDRFGHGAVAHARLTVDPGHLEPIRGRLEVPPARASLAPGGGRGLRPPEATLQRPVVATRAPENPGRWLRPHGLPEPPTSPAMSPRLVPPPARGERGEHPPRPPFGASTIERPRSAPPPPPTARPPAVQRGPRPEQRVLPGEPANRLFPGRSTTSLGRPAAPSVRAPGATAPRQTPGEKATPGGPGHGGGRPPGR
jgi:hypothetical protein